MAPKKSLKEHYEDGTLDLSLSEIQDIPVKDIAAIPKAVTLDLSSNIIVSIPKNFASSLSHLVKLDLSQNQITALPDNFGLLVNLKHLDLENNKIESLPLSFGNLKSLRWLDIKRNPLMPKLAQIAGLCLDAQQCQQAARNVVAALRDMQEQVNAEITRRKEKQEAKKAIQEENTKHEAKESNTSKKKKKKGPKNGPNAPQVNGHHVTNKEEEHLLSANNENLDTSPAELSLKRNNKPGLFSRVFSLLAWMVKVVVMSSLVIMCGVFLLTVVDPDLYTALVAKVPQPYWQYRERGHRALATWSTQLLELTLHCYHKLHDHAATLSSHENVQHFLESLQSGWHILWIRLCETCSTLSEQLPHYFESIRNIFNSARSS